jgi:hypothetical protein
MVHAILGVRVTAWGDISAWIATVAWTIGSEANRQW